MDIKQQKRIRRHKKIRARIKGTKKTPRLSVFKSNQYINAQIIDDDNGKTLLSLTDKKVKGKTKTEKAKEAGIALAKQSKEQKINNVVFDRGGYIYTGRIKAFAEGAREGGLKF